MIQTSSASDTFPRRLARDAGIAIGPILFIIAVLGILASAIAAGSGSFTSNTTSESNRAKAAALIDIGQTIKIGFDRLLGAGTDFDDIIVDTAQTSGDTDLFSPTGGGVSPPSSTMAADSTDVWHFPLWVVPNVCSDDGCRIAILRVSLGVCDEINLKANGLAKGKATADSANLGDFSVTTLNTLGAWNADFNSKTIGCVHNTDSTAIAAGYYFFQVLGGK